VLYYLTMGDILLVLSF